MTQHPDDASAMRREFAEAIKQRGNVPQQVTVERMEDALQRMQERGKITLRRHDGRVVLIWGRV